MPIVVYIGEQLRNVRTRRLLTQDELADKAGVNQSTIANIERTTPSRSSALSASLPKPSM